MCSYVIEYSETRQCKDYVQLNKNVSFYSVSFCSEVKVLSIDIIKQDHSTYKVLVVHVGFEFF